MEKKLFYIPARKRIVSLENSHKYKLYSFYKECIEIPNDPIMNIEFTVNDSRYVTVQYKVGNTVVNAVSKTDPNHIIKNCSIDDGTAYGPFLWAKVTNGMELVKVGTDLFRKAQKKYEDEHRKRIRKFIVGGIYKWRGSEYQYLGICKYYKQSINSISMSSYNRDTTTTIELCESPIWLNLKHGIFHSFKCPRIYEQLSKEDVNVNDILNKYRVNIDSIDRYQHLSIAKTIHVKELTGNIKEYIDKFTNGKRTFKGY